MPELCFAMLCPLDVEEKLLDELLSRFPDEVFTSTHTHGHGLAHEALSAAEQVLGRARGLLVQILLTQAEWAEFKPALLRQFRGTGLRYWTTPVLEAGGCA